MTAPVNRFGRSNEDRLSNPEESMQRCVMTDFTGNDAELEPIEWRQPALR
jgi:hypothetical protein